MKTDHINFSLFACTLILLFTLFSSTSHAEIPTQYGLGVTGGNSYDPSSDITWVQGTFVAVYDYDSIWPHRAPEPLAFRVEAQAGATLRDDIRAIVSLNMYAQYYLYGLSNASWLPYLDAGIGVIYTDFQVEGQGLRINFNPQIGFGTDFTDSNGNKWFGDFRLHHISNAGIDDENRGVNSVTFTIGRYF